MKAKIYTTAKETDERLSFSGEYGFEFKNTDIVETYDKSEDVESCIINLHPDIKYHTFNGFGGAFTESAASAWYDMNADKREELISAYFDSEHGIGYTFGRIHINSCDFSTEDYTYVKEGDMTLESFDISRDKQKIIPMIKSALQKCPLKIFASPWSPPKYMKTVDSVRGGHLKKECRELWAQYFKKFISEYKKEGIDIWGVTIQNEPRHHQLWESCLYTPAEEADFLGYLGRALEGMNVKILCYDHCRERLFERAVQIFESENGRYCDGIASHWYSGDHFGEIKAVSEKYPDKLCVMSEGCCFDPNKGIKVENAWDYGESYAHDISGAVSSGMNYYCDWNLTLDENNGPFHRREGRNLVDVPVYCNRQTGKLVYQPSYYYIGHYSKFIRPGAVCINYSSYTDGLDVCAFENTDSSIVCVVLNANDEKKDAVIRIGNNILRNTLSAHSIKTFVIIEA